MIAYPSRDVVPWRGRPRWHAAAAHLPSDKSISHRLLLFAALVDHPVTIHGLNQGRAVTLLADALAQLGVAIEREGPATVTVHGSLAHVSPGDRGTVDLGPSSAAARLLIGALAGLGIACTVDGDETLRNRPFDWIVDPLRAMGAELEYLGRPGALPIRVGRGAFVGGAATTHIGSAQAVSALLYAGMAARRPVAVTYPVVSRDHTQRIAARFGERIRDDGRTVRLEPGALRVPREVRVPRDPSALAYVAALFWLVHRDEPAAEVRFDGVCLNPTRLGFFAWAARCGFRFDVEAEDELGGEPVGAIVLRGGGRDARAADLASKRELHAMIDEIPLAVALASLLPGRSRFAALDELTFKETDRIAATRDLLAAFGVRVDVDGTDVEVAGPQELAVGAAVPSFGDHRLSMTAHVLLLAHRLGARVVDGECYRTSFPGFGACVDAILGGGDA
jgi:3-phosphoshikimate 1-carboxyvinyltransferase